jgi:hypothetical protein
MPATVVYVEETGHVIAGVTRASDTGTDLTVGDLVPGDLTTRILGFDVVYRASDLGVAHAELPPSELLDPLALRVALDAGGTQRNDVGKVLGTGNVAATYKTSTKVLTVTCQSVGTATLGVHVWSPVDFASGLVVPAATPGTMSGDLTIDGGSTNSFLVLVDGYGPRKVP